MPDAAVTGVGALVRGMRPDERARVQALVVAAYAEFESALAPKDYLRMGANLARVVAEAPATDLLIATVPGGGTDGAETLAGTVTYLPPGPREYDRVPRDWAVVRALAVAPPWRGRGLARLLTEHCLDRARRDGAPAVGLHTMDRMTVARGMYEGMGFVAQREFEHLGLRFWIYRLDLDTGLSAGAGRAAPGPAPR